MYNIEYCKTKKGFEAKLEKRKNLDMDLLKKEFSVIADAGIVIVLGVDNEEIIVHDYGTLLFKACKDEKKAKRIAEKIYGAGLKNE